MGSFLKIVFVIWGIFWLNVSFRIVLSISVENATGILKEIVLSLQLMLHGVDILTTLSIKKTGKRDCISLHVCSARGAVRE